MAEGPTQVGRKDGRTSNGEADVVRLLALEIRPQKAGYAVFEDSTLVDWGVTRYGTATPASRRIGSLLSLHGPDVVVTRWRPRLRHSRTGASVVHKIKREAQRRSIRVRILDAPDFG